MAMNEQNIKHYAFKDKDTMYVQQSKQMYLDETWNMGQ
jgi:hypothetical protein